MSMTFVRRGLAALAVVAAVAAGPTAVAAESSSTAAPTRDARAGVRFVGIELRPTGRIGPCTPSTPTPCSSWAYVKQCSMDIPNHARVVRVRTYMIAVDPSVVGFRLRARLVPRSGSALGIPWAVHTETFASQSTRVSRLMDAKPVSEYVEVQNHRWDLVVEARFDRRGRPDDVRIWREPVRFSCS